MGDRSIPVCDEHYDELSRDPDLRALQFQKFRRGLWCYGESVAKSHVDLSMTRGRAPPIRRRSVRLSHALGDSPLTASRNARPRTLGVGP